MGRSIVQFGVTDMGARDCAFDCLCKCEFDRLFVLFLSFRSVPIRMGMGRIHRDVVISCHEILVIWENRLMLMPASDTFFRLLALCCI